MHIKLKRCFYALTATVLVLLVFILTGCDGPLAISGTVYEWVDAPSTAHSQVYLNQYIPDVIRLSPIENAKITIFFKVTYDKGNREYIVTSATTDASGNFQTHTITDPNKTTYVVTVDKAGYLEGSTEFISPSKRKYVSPADNNYTHFIKAVLVKEIPSK